MKKLFTIVVLVMLVGCVGTQKMWHPDGGYKLEGDFNRDKAFCEMESMKIRPTLHPQATFWGNSQTVYFKKCMMYKGYALR